MIRAELIQGNIIVWDIESGRELYKLGYYGKPLGISKPKSFDFDAPLILDIIEAVYLVEKNLLEVYENGRRLSLEELMKRAEEHYENFRERYLVYKDLRDLSLIHI